MKYFSEVMKQAKGDIHIALQSYNFGNGFTQFAIERGGYSKEVVTQFSQIIAKKLGWSRYGDVNYVEHFLRYYNTENGSIVVGEDGTQCFDVEEVRTEVISNRVLG